MRKNFNLRPFYFVFTLLSCVLFAGCYQSKPERSNPFDPENSSTAGDPFNLRADPFLGPFYGQIHLTWNIPSNSNDLTFKIYRQKPDSPQFTLLGTASENIYHDDDSVFVYNRDKYYVYRVSAFSKNEESQTSQDFHARPYRFPKLKRNQIGTGKFLRGVQSRINPNWMYVLDVEFKTIQVFYISSNQFDRFKFCQVQKPILNYALTELNGIEYILSIAPDDASLFSCKIENNIVSDLASTVISFAGRPTAIASGAPNDSSVFVAITTAPNRVKVVKINYVKPRIVEAATLTGDPVWFMLFKENLERLFLLSKSSGKVDMLSSNLQVLYSINIGNMPENFVDSPDPDFLFVSCNETALIFSLKIVGNRIEAFPIRRGSDSEIFSWVNCSRGEESDVLLYYLIYDKPSSKYRVETWQTINKMNDAKFVRSLNLEEQIGYGGISSITYIHDFDENQPVRNLYLFSRNLIYYFVPETTPNRN